ncbi:hypothetical protein GJ744_002188 [Endocarpon pusillum]|uniref:Uncharacterized protein n=1 Tax=Endocarpon pusillum TaxID=364733 RepID=A0A8H7AC75_9EURO|nr:hypothetical protein GJ744_002188 [Endocarpon pusillum]
MDDGESPGAKGLNPARSQIGCRLARSSIALGVVGTSGKFEDFHYAGVARLLAGLKIWQRRPSGVRIGQTNSLGDFLQVFSNAGVVRRSLENGARELTDNEVLRCSGMEEGRLHAVLDDNVCWEKGEGLDGNESRGINSFEA